MDEHTLQKRLKRLSITVAVISVLILAAGSLASYYLRNILEDALTEQMKSDTGQYKIISFTHISRKGMWKKHWNL